MYCQDNSVLLLTDYGFNQATNNTYYSRNLETIISKIALQTFLVWVDLYAISSQCDIGGT